MERSPEARLVLNLAALPVFVILAYIDSQSEASIWSDVLNALSAIGYLIAFVVGAVSLIVFGVSATGRLKSGPDAVEEPTVDSRADISSRTFFLLFGYVVLFGIAYFSGVKIGSVSLANLSGFVNGVLFCGPIWVAFCLAKYRSDRMKRAT